ncbi:MAG: hypothetical protein ACLUEQ_02905 [Cloacibacillus evryensis]
MAPTGTIAPLANCSSGIEPLFARTYARAHADRRHKGDHEAGEPLL